MTAPDGVSRPVFVCLRCCNGFVSLCNENAGTFSLPVCYKEAVSKTQKGACRHEIQPYIAAAAVPVSADRLRPSAHGRPRPAGDGAALCFGSTAGGANARPAGDRNPRRTGNTDRNAGGAARRTREAVPLYPREFPEAQRLHIHGAAGESHGLRAAGRNAGGGQ